MSIYKNAIDSIIIGVEDYKLAENGDQKRYISSTRNIFAGLLLLFKHKLSELSPDDSDEILIKQKIRPSLDSSSEIKWVGSGNKTVDVNGIKERFKDLDIKTNWNTIDHINKYRNNIEHYYSTESEDSVKAMISGCFVVMRDFIVKELNLVPIDELGEKTWTYLIGINKVYQAEKNECIKNLENLDWIDKSICELSKNVYCDDCLSDLINVNENNEIYCSSCGKKFNQETIVENILENEYGLSWADASQGGECTIYECPSCNNHTYVSFENKCMFCGDQYSTECDICGCIIPGEELDGSGVCGYCQHMRNKND